MRAHRRRGDAAALGIYALAWIGLVGRFAVADPAHTCACLGDAEATNHYWSFVWWPHALVHGIDPFISHVIWVPEGGNVAASALTPAAAFLAWPVTAAFGPIVAYNVWFFLGPVLAAWLTFRLCRYLGAGWLPSLVGGYVFGFSSYVLGQMLGHMNLVLVFLVPAAVHLVLLWLDERLSRRRFVALMTALLVFQFLLSVEVLVTLLLFGAVALALGYLLVPARRPRVRQMLPDLLLAGVIAGALVSPYLYNAVDGLGKSPSVNYTVTSNLFSADPLNYVLPTPTTWIGHDLTDSVAAKFNSRDGGAHGRYDESGAYLGLPLLLIVGLFLFSHRRRRSAQLLFGVLAVVFVASLGAHLHVANPPHGGDVHYDPSIPLPWRAVTTLPVMDHILPVRLAMYVFLIAAVVVALWLSEPSRRAWARWLLAGAGVLLLLPNQALPYWRQSPPDPAFFTGKAYKRHLAKNEVALVFPYADNGNSMLWQAETGMYFRMAGGYISSDVPEGYYREPVVRAMLTPAAMGPITPARWGRPLRDFILRRRIGAVIVGPGNSDGWPAVVASLGLPPRRVGGVLVYDVPRRWRYSPAA